MMIDCVLAACVENLTPNNDLKYWDLCVVLSYFIPPRIAYVKRLIQEEESFQIENPPDYQIGAVKLFVSIALLLFQFVRTPSMQLTSILVILFVD